MNIDAGVCYRKWEGEGEGTRKFITAAQRNEAFDALQHILFSIRAIHHYALHHSMDRDKDESEKLELLLPVYFATHPMPELPMADLRLLNTEMQLLKNKAHSIQEFILPKEKFRFKRYHKLMHERKMRGAGLTPGIAMYDGENNEVEGEDEKNPLELEGGENNENGGDDNDSNNANANASEGNSQGKEQNTKNENTPANAALTAFDGLTLSKEEHREILVNANGNFTLRENGVVVKSVNHDNVSLDAKAFLIRDLNHCQVQV